MTQALNQRTVSTWSLHRTLGNFVAEDSAIGGGPFMQLPDVPEQQSLVELIPELAARGYTALQICHFHLESRDPEYLQEVRDALARNAITLEMLLIDDGDLMAEDIGPQIDWYDSWLDAAESLGANRARICAGRSEPTPERLTRSGEYLAHLASKHHNVRIVTENWMEATPDAESVLAVLAAAGESVGLLIDLANWSAPEKYDQLALIAPLAESCHAKCIFKEHGPDDEDFRTTLGILVDADFDGPLALIYDGPDGDEWAGLEREWEIVQDVFQ